jgi:hypothetical protein
MEGGRGPVSDLHHLRLLFQAVSVPERVLNELLRQLFTTGERHQSTSPRNAQARAPARIKPSEGRGPRIWHCVARGVPIFSPITACDDVQGIPARSPRARSRHHYARTPRTPSRPSPAP